MRTVAPWVHFEWQPPHMTALKSCLPVPMVKAREPESSAGMNSAPQTPQGSSASEGTCCNPKSDFGHPANRPRDQGVE